jgi:hypothetical protein
LLPGLPAATSHLVAFSSLSHCSACTQAMSFSVNYGLQSNDLSKTLLIYLQFLKESHFEARMDSSDNGIRTE